MTLFGNGNRNMNDCIILTVSFGFKIKNQLQKSVFKISLSLKNSLIAKILNLGLVDHSSKNNVHIKILNPIAWLGRAVKCLKSLSRLFLQFSVIRFSENLIFDQNSIFTVGNGILFWGRFMNFDSHEAVFLCFGWILY